MSNTLYEFKNVVFLSFQFFFLNPIRKKKIHGISNIELKYIWQKPYIFLGFKNPAQSFMRFLLAQSH